jgi:poly-gamma-glutamate capsule biosynthesis protein CapA/YwtB (metallophosphatase superfamily)
MINVGTPIVEKPNIDSQEVKPGSSTPQEETSISPVAPKEQIPQTLNIIGVGDIMLGTNYPSAKYLPANKGRNLLKSVNGILKKADVTFGNLEGTILNKGPTIKHCKNCYAFRMPEYLADNLVTAGFDVVSIANNHARDFGQRGLKNTIKVLTKLNIESAGLLNRRETATFEKNGVKYGFAAFAPNVGTVDIRKIPRAKEIVQQLDQANDIVIVSFHGGAEGTARQHVRRKTEYYYGENRGNVHKFAHAVIDAGADIVFGHGPHVTRAVEVYNKRFIAYSLGNFCTYGRFSLRGATGVAPIIDVEIKNGPSPETKGEFVKAKITPIRQIKNSRVVKGGNAISIIRKLTREDGFLTNITISKNGWITYR